MKPWYDLTLRYQDALDSLDLVEKVNWVGCETEKKFKGEGWP